VSEVGDASLFGTVMSGRYEVIDGEFVVFEKRVDVGLIENAGALALGENEVEEEAEADPGVERDPEKNELSP